MGSQYVEFTWCCCFDISKTITRIALLRETLSIMVEGRHQNSENQNLPHGGHVVSQANAPNTS